jgi:hypothetical protein
VLWIVEAFELSLDAAHPVVAIRINFFSITYNIRSNIE